MCLGHLVRSTAAFVCEDEVCAPHAKALLETNYWLMPCQGLAWLEKGV